MNSSTSNSRGALIIRSTAVFLVLFIGYNLAVMVAKPAGSFLQSQPEKNAAVADDYILGERAADTVIVGSSLSARLDESDLGPGFLNLSFAGGTAATGLEIVDRLERVPKLVLVETNQIRNLDSSFVDARFSPLGRFLKRRIPTARAKYRPVNLLLGALRKKTGREDLTPDATVFANLLEEQRRDYENVPDPEWLRSSVTRMAQQVASLEAKGVRVVFFVLPVYPQLRDLPKARDLLQAFHTTFPPPGNRWIECPPGDFITADGIHLVPQSARLYAGLLLAELRHGPQ
ncbi:MAG: hypothetical protein ABI036_11230 [Fibrobacteria bacterium]